MARAAKLGGTIALDGEKEYKKAIDEITAGLKVNYTQMGLVAAQYAVAGNSEEALRAKSVALSDTIASQTEKIELMRGQLAKSIEKNGEGSKTTMQYQAALNKAETELVKMNNQMDGYQQQLAQVNEETHDTAKSTKSLADVAMGMADTFGLSVPPAMQNTISKLDGVSASGAAAVGMIGAMVAGLAKLTIGTSQTADNLLTLSSTTGLSTDALQEFEYASELLDVSSDTMQGSLTKLIKNMATAKGGTGEAAEAFKTLHIKVANSNGSLKDANEVFYKAIDALGKVKNETDRDAMSMQIFGKSARDLNPLIEAGSARLKELGVEAHNVGYVMDNETLQQFGQLDDAMQRMSKQSDALKNSLALALLPMLTGLFETIGKIPVPVLQTVIAIVGAVTVLLLMVKAIKELSSTAGAIKTFFTGFDVAALKTTAIIVGVVAALIALGVVIAVIIGKKNELKEAMNSVGNAVGQVTATTNAAQNNYPKYAYATGTNFHPGGRAVVGENGPEVIDLPRGSRVYPNGKYPKDGGNYVDQRQYIFKVENIETYMAIERRLKNEQKSIRQGVI